MTFPIDIAWGERSIPVHPLFEIMAFQVAGLSYWYLRKRKKDHISINTRFAWPTRLSRRRNSSP